MEKKSIKINSKKDCWVVAFIDSTYMHKVQDELNKYPEYKEVEAFIPVVKIVTKTFKGAHKMQEVPLLFNYGFFKIPRKFAVHAEFLKNMQQNVSCIFSWVKDPVKTASKKLKELKAEAEEISHIDEYSDLNIPVATATPEEISLLLKDAFSYSAHSSEDLDRLKPGDLIQLRGYPWDGVDAEIVEINFEKREVKVTIDLMGRKQPVTVTFDNVFFTVYHNNNHDDSLSTIGSLDAMAEKHTLDKAIFKNQRNG